MKYLFNALLALALFAPGPCLAGEAGAGRKRALTRDEVAVFKKKLVTVLDALGAPPDGFVKQQDDFNLPAEFYMQRGELVSNQAGAIRELAVKGAKDSEAAKRKAAEERQKKILEAQAKSDYQEMSRLMQETQQEASQAAFSGVQAREEKKLPIEVRVRFNSSEYRGIDPDMILLERKGALALKTEQGEPGNPAETVTIYFQPKALEDTDTISRVELKTGPVPSKTSVSSITIELEGPAAEVEAWAKRLDYKKVLAQIDATVE